MNNPVQDQEKIDRLQKALGDDYTILKRLGGGGMGDVYMATHRTLGGKWAIKLLAEHLAEDAELVDRFMNEARIEANLQHPNIVKVVNIGQKDKFHFLIMTFVDGEDLDQRLKRLRRMDVQEVINIGLQVVRALECAHDNGIVHRDLKPSNIRIDDQYGTVVVMDFGIARIRDSSSKVKTVLGQQLGTPLYMSPEQAAGRAVDVRSDFYSLGVILYEMLAGANPFEAENHYAIVMKQLTESPQPLSDVRQDVPRVLSDLIARLLEKDPAKRYQTASEVRQDLSALGGGADIRTAPRSVQPPIPEHLKKLGPLDAVLHSIPDTQIQRPLTSTENGLLTLIDGSKTIREILKACGLVETEAANAIASLQSAGAIYSEIPLGEDGAEIDDATRIQRTTRRPSSIFPPATPAPATRLEAAPKVQRKVVPVWLPAAIGAVVIAGVIGVFFALRTPSTVTAIKVDASPFAMVTILSEDETTRIQEPQDTPFTVALAPGSYVFEFRNDDQTKRVPMAIGPDLPDAVRADFWNADETQKLLDGYLK